MLPKPFAYVCLVLLVAVAAYHGAPRSVAAQGGAELVAGASYNRMEFAITPDGRVYTRSLEGQNEPWYFDRTVSVPSPVVDFVVEAGAVPPNPVYRVFCLDGTVIHCDWATGSCTSSNVLGGGPVPATRETFGALKSRYRGTPGAAQPTQDR